MSDEIPQSRAGALCRSRRSSARHGQRELLHQGRESLRFCAQIESDGVSLGLACDGLTHHDLDGAIGIGESVKGCGETPGSIFGI